MTRPASAKKQLPLVKILQEKVVYSFKDTFKVVEALLQFRRFDGQMSDPITRIYFERGDSVAMLLYAPKTDFVLLARQFRYPVYAALPPDQSSGQGTSRAWLLETFAGMIDPGKTAAEVASKELLEEAGYHVLPNLSPVATFYASPGGTSERISVYIVEVEAHQKVSLGGGVIAEGEDIQIVELPFKEALAMVERGEITDAKTIIALQHLALHGKDRRGEAFGADGLNF
jgi:ADP-ribose pyrophosphatase